jgi:hypothetical protein
MTMDVAKMKGASIEVVRSIQQVAGDEYYVSGGWPSPQDLFDDLLNDLETVGLLDDPPRFDDACDFDAEELDAVKRFLSELRPIALECFANQSLSYADVLATAEWQSLKETARSLLTVLKRIIDHADEMVRRQST